MKWITRLPGLAAASALLLGGSLLPATTVNAAPWPVDKPNDTGISNPGVVRTSQHGWVLMHTHGPFNRGGVMTSDTVGGDFVSTGRPILDRDHRPAWMNPNRGLWAPTLVKAKGSAQWVAFFSGVVEGWQDARCIGTAVSDDPRGSFRALNKPLACFNGSGRRGQDQISLDGNPRQKKLIDPDPALVRGQLVLTYKAAEFLAGGEHRMTQRMLKLDPENPTRMIRNPVRNGSIALARIRTRSIEENPVLVERGQQLTLFTSYGGYRTCNYHTRYRQNRRLWHGWLGTSPTDLPIRANTCGDGNADVARLANGSWRLLFNGHTRSSEGNGGPPNLYSGILVWDQGRPRVSGLAR